MIEDNLRLMVLAIAVNIDYTKEEYERNLAPDSSPQQVEDPAFYIMNNALLARFKDAWREGIPAEKMANTVGIETKGLDATTTALAVIPEHGQGLRPLSSVFTNTLDALVFYCALELSWSFYRLPVSSTVDMLAPRRSEIIRRIWSSTTRDLVTELASRRCVYEAIRNHLYKSNTRTEASIYNKIRNSNRPEAVFDMFKAHFRERSATSFQFRGSFLNFIMNTYQNHFYNSILKPEIWNKLTEEDQTKMEQEMDSHTVRYISGDEAPKDMFIHNLLVSIGEANNKLFTHTGHAKGGERETEDRGVMYDIVYGTLVYLCENMCEQLNQKLPGFRLEFYDPLSRDKVGRANKNIAAKINNAKQLIPVMFEYIRKGNFSPARILDFRRECYRYGRSNTQGRDPIWVAEGKTSEGQASYFLDTEEGQENIKTFETVFRGIASTYSLLKAQVKQGKNLVDEYLRGRGYRGETPSVELFCAWYVNPNFYRYIDYMSALDYIDDLFDLQEQSDAVYQQGRLPSADNVGSGELLDFEGQRDVWAGSSKHTEAHINANRAYAKNRGLLDKPRLKQRSELTTVYEKKRSVAKFLTSIPYSFREFDNRRMDKAIRLSLGTRTRNRYAPSSVPVEMFEWRGVQDDNMKYSLDISDVMELGEGTYDGLQDNIILKTSDGYAKEHMRFLDNGHITDWHIGTHGFPGVMMVMDVGKMTGVISDKGRDVQVEDVVHFVINYMHIPLIDSMHTTFFSDGLQCGYPALAWHGFDRSGEVQWLNDNRRVGGSYCRLPMCYDPHAIAMAADRKLPKKLLPERLTPEEIKDPAILAIAKERLAKSLGFAVYIGVDNLNTKDVWNTLERIPVWQDYKQQVRLYVDWLVELNWMQKAFVKLLELMFTTCWYLCIPDNRMDSVYTVPAKSLFNSLMNRRFKREDLEWFFSLLSSSYVDQNGNPVPEYSRPKEIVNFGDNRTPENRREVIQPTWALLLGGVFSDWTEKFDLVPETNFEDGPYQRYQRLIHGGNDVSEQFVLLHGFLYEKTLYLKVLRDCYTLTFNRFGEDNNTLACELGTILNLKKQFNPRDPKWGADVAALARSDIDIYEHITQQVIQDNIEFEVLHTALSEYYEDCSGELQKMVSYGVATGDELASRFSKWGDAMAAIPPVTGSIMLDTIRGRYVCDEHKFVFKGNDYFKIPWGMGTGYLHYSGHLLVEQRNGEFYPEAIDISSADKLSNYDQRLEQGMRDAGI